ncbi:MAG: hypothetical protein MUE52_14995 [Tabrizicola sp.]|nr:hypothetical protein [Tabrizicola sp.]
MHLFPRKPNHNALGEKGQGPPWWIALIAVAAMLVSVNLDQLFTRASISTTVRQAELPTHCTSSEPLFPWPISRSSPPEPGVPFCGVVITDHGSFRVIEDGMFVFGSMDRADIVSGLLPGCTVTLHYYGWAGPPRQWPGYDPRTTRWIYAIENPASCERFPELQHEA